MYGDYHMDFMKKTRKLIWPGNLTITDHTDQGMARKRHRTQTPTWQQIYNLSKTSSTMSLSFPPYLSLSLSLSLSVKYLLNRNNTKNYFRKKDQANHTHTHTQTSTTIIRMTALEQRVAEALFASEIYIK